MELLLIFFLLALVVSAGSALLIIYTVRRNKNKKTGGKQIALSLVIAMPISAVIGFLMYTMVFYKAEPMVNEYLVTDETVRVEDLKLGYFFDGPGEDTAVIFYPGAKVEYTAYAPMLREVAENGADCFLLRMPFNIAFLDLNAGDGIMARYKYDHWYLAGHSLGGATAAMYFSENDIPDGIILLAAYSPKKISEDKRALVICGTNDGCLNREVFEEKRSMLPASTEFVEIVGGNHAGFGCYGAQRDDNPADISPEDQRSLTVGYITAFLMETADK